MTNNENLVGTLRILWQWRKKIARVVVIATLGTALISFFLHNYYKSSTIFYAASPDLFKPEQLFGGDKSVDYYGTDSDIDRLLTIANSNELVEYMVKHFNLYAHYDIDSTKKNASFKMKERFFELYNIQKTKYDALELSVEDVDSKFSAEMANEARNKIDQIAQSLIKNSQEKLMESVTKDIEHRQKDLIVLGDSLSFLRKKYGIYDLSSGEVLAGKVAEAESNYNMSKAKLKVLEKDPHVKRDTLAMIRANTKGYEEELISLTADSSKSNFNIKRFNEGISHVTIITQMHGSVRDQLSRDINRLGELKAAYDNKISAIHLIETAIEPVQKSRPKRSIIILVAGLAAFFFSCIGVLLLERYKDLPEQITQA